MKWTRVSRFVIIAFFLPLLAYSQTAPSGTDTPSLCPLDLRNFRPWEIRVHVENTSGKTIVGLVFNVALSDATEHWRWLHWGFDDSRPLREFGWNKALKPGAQKTLWWQYTDLDFEHAGGGAFVLTSALFEDGSSWEEPAESASCKIVWHNHHKKRFNKQFYCRRGNREIARYSARKMATAQKGRTAAMMIYCGASGYLPSTPKS